MALVKSVRYVVVDVLGRGDCRARARTKVRKLTLWTSSVDADMKGYPGA
jgi:hypothetical protein